MNVPEVLAQRSLRVRGDAVSIGTCIPTLIVVPTAIQLFRYSAITWNAHRIHYDREAAINEGHPDILVQAHLHGAFLTRMVMDWITPQGRLLGIQWSNRARAIPGDTLTCSGVVESVTDLGGRWAVALELSERNQHAQICAVGSATVSIREPSSP